MGTDQVLLHRFVVSQLTAAGVDRDRLLRESGLPEWTMAGDDVHLPSQTFSRLWEIGEHALGDPDVALNVASRYQLLGRRPSATAATGRRLAGARRGGPGGLPDRR
ncbi:AraC family transcriptional regulator ligand-binding domain-containing protein [Nocardia abscessus]|uniref:AraC family transcriptional regulator ligand-binding domain-containing protein n=1 Tax=Nocardia abscessus TaxID=120957 RepID=UPI0024569E0C|nr:AraC family transcriptional regulator ligand-binding domain-containing protein [Nocardia abscessus]